MTHITNISLLLLMGSSILLANPTKLYEIKSGKIEYQIKGSGEIMGSKMHTTGKKSVVFDAYGAKNLTEQNKIDKQTIMGQVKTTQSHTMTYMKKGIIYHVNFDKKRIMRMENMGPSMVSLMGGHQNMKESGEEMMKSMGGQKIGTDTILGYTCDIWDMLGTKQCMYKGLPLRVETNVMGLKNQEIATKIEFDLTLSSHDFNLPDFPIYNSFGEKLEKTQLEAMDNTQEADTQKAMKEMALQREALAKAKQEAGIQEGERGTTAQQAQMQNSMMEAMLPRMKQEMLENEEVMRVGYACLTKADTLKEANVCNDKVNAMGGEPEEPFDAWDADTKKETLGFITQYLDVMMPCIKQAQTMKAVQLCIPRE